MLKSFLAQRDVPCPNCAYNLHGLQNSICPECRQELTLCVSLQRPVQKNWLFTIIPLWIVGSGALIAATLVFTIAHENIMRGLQQIFSSNSYRRQPDIYIFVIYPTFVGLILTPLAYWLSTTKGRRWFARHPHRKIIMLLCIALSAAAVIAWTVWMLLEFD